MDYRPDWIDGTDEPAIAVLVSNSLSKMARRENQITEEVTKIKQRVDRMIHTFERSNEVLSSIQGPDMEIMENMDELENVFNDPNQKRKYQQKLTVFIVGFQEACGQRRHLLTQLQEFFSIYSNMNEVEGDQYLGQSCVDLDGIAFQVTGAVRSAEAAMSRLTELHKVVMGHLNQAVSAATQAKRKPLDDRGRKKLDKLLDQARQDIGQLTDRLLQTQEDLTLKDQQMKELQKQNEMRVMEIHHVKSQMEVTKQSLQILQEQTAIQRSFLEAEIRRQAGQLDVLEDQKALKREQLTDSSTQWEILDCMFRNNDEDITANNVEENLLKKSLEAAEETSLTDINDEHNKMQNFAMQLISIDTDNDFMDDMTKPESQECISPSFPVFEDNISATSLIPVLDKDNLVHTVSNVEEYNSTSHHLSANNKSCMTPPPNLPIIHNDANNHRVNDSSLLNLVVPQEITPSFVNKFEQVILLSLTNENVQSAISQPNSEEITDSGVIFPLPGNGSDITPPYNETEQVNHTVSLSETYNSPIFNEAAQSAKADTNTITHLIPNKRSSLMSAENINPMTSTDISNTDNHLKNPVFSPNFELDENTYRCLPDVNIMIAPSSDNTYTTSVSESNQDASGSKTVSPPNKKSQYCASSPVIHQTSELNTSLSVLSGIHSIKTLPLTNMNINMDQSISTISQLLPEGKSLPMEAPEEDVTAKETILSTKPSFHARQGEAETVKTFDHHHTELRWLSERLHKCVAEIRNLLITEGFHSLADVLAQGIADKSKEGLSINLTQLENFPAVLQSLLHNITRRSTEHKELTDEHSPDSAISKEEDRNKIDSSLPVKHTEESQKCDGLPQDTSRMMSKYHHLCQERLRSLVWGYVQYISWNRAEDLLRKQCLSKPHITPVLHKLQKQKHQAFLQWRDKILQSQEQRLRLLAVLNQTAHGVHEDTGIFLIKPLISWAGSSVQETHKQIISNQKTVRHSCFPPVCQDGISCHGISPTRVTKKWKYMHTHTELRPLVVTPKLLEMDIHRYLCKECCVISKIQHSLHGLPLKRNLIPKNLVIKQTTSFPAL